MSTNPERLVDLPAEKWGERLRRARGKTHLTEAAERLAIAWPISHMTVARLEQMDGPPTARRQQVLAVLLLLSYGIDPEAFGLSIGVVPASIDLERVICINAGITAWPAWGALRSQTRSTLVSPLTAS